VKKGYVWLAVVGAVWLFSFFTFQFQVVKTKQSATVSSAVQSGVVSEYKDITSLGAHQVAIDDLYIEIPFKKENAEIVKRTTDEYVFIDIRQKDDKNILFTYGESIGDKQEELICREIHSDKATVTIQAVVEIDASNAKINSVNNTLAEYQPEPTNIDREFVGFVSRTGEFPAEKVEINAHIGLNYEGQRKELYEGYLIGVIPK